MDPTELLQAAGEADMVTLARLLESGGDPDALRPLTGATALCNASFGGHAEVVRMLVAHGADPNKRVTYRSPVDGRIETGIVALMRPPRRQRWWQLSWKPERILAPRTATAVLC